MITAKTSDINAVLRHTLMQDQAVFSIADGRVYTSHGRDAEEATRTYPTVIMEHHGGTDYAQAPVAARRVYLYAYSNRSADEAFRLYDAVKEVLQRRGVGGRLDAMGQPCEPVCAYGIERSGVFNGWNPEVSAWFVRGEWSIWAFGG